MSRARQAPKRDAVAPLRATDLRTQAERALRAVATAVRPGPDAASPQHAARTLHELHVHQIELEMQNDELQRSQAELFEANRRYGDLYDQAPVGYFTVSEGDAIVQANLTAATLLGLERSALLKQRFSRYIVREDMDSYYLMCRALRKSGLAQSAELRMQRQDGTPFWAQLEANGAGDVQDPQGPRQLRLVLSDISARKALEAEREHYRADLEEQVKRRTQELLDLYDQAPCGYHSLNADGVLLRVNQTALTLLGYAREELVGQRLVDCMTLQSARLFQETFAHLRETGSARNIEVDFHCKDGTIRPFSIDAEWTPAAPGEAPLCRCTMVDISERRHAVQRLELALMASDLGLWDVQLATGELHLSARACAMLGYPEGGLGAQLGALEALVHPDDVPVRRAALQAIQNGDVPYYRAEYRLRHKDGHWVWVRSRGRVVARDEKSAPLRAVGTLHDISQEKQLQLESADLLQRIEALIQGLGKAGDAPPPPLQVAASVVIGSREQQVVQLIAAGCTSAEIGRHLGISTSTAATHRRNLMRKLDLHSAAELTRYALAHKLISN